MAALTGSTHSINGLDHFVSIALPRGWSRDSSRPAVIVLPGTAEIFNFPYLPAVGQPLISQIVEAGYPVAAVQASSTIGGAGNLWANDKAYGFIDAMRIYMQSTAVGAKSGKVILVGLSQGALNVLAYAGRYPANVAAVQAYLPNTSLAGTAATPGYSASVNAAYSGGYSDAIYGATHSPEIMMNNSTNPYTMPINLVYANNDALIPFSYPSTFANTINGRTDTNNVQLIDGGATGHDWAITWSSDVVKNALQQLLAYV